MCKKTHKSLWKPTSRALDQLLQGNCELLRIGAGSGAFLPFAGAVLVCGNGDLDSLLLTHRQVERHVDFVVSGLVDEEGVEGGLFVFVGDDARVALAAQADRLQIVRLEDGVTHVQRAKVVALQIGMHHGRKIAVQVPRVLTHSDTLVHGYSRLHPRAGTGDRLVVRVHVVERFAEELQRLRVERRLDAAPRRGAHLKRESVRRDRWQQRVLGPRLVLPVAEPDGRVEVDE
mmetsp:Transcript_45637/g.99373  ORF Transcript_45637/g.99373 Transcript_45637/m.99373 type:complete len:231 (+) Transcript_45637:210-902(+)